MQVNMTQIYWSLITVVIVGMAFGISVLVFNMVWVKIEKKISGMICTLISPLIFFLTAFGLSFHLLVTTDSGIYVDRFVPQEITMITGTFGNLLAIVFLLQSAGILLSNLIVFFIQRNFDRRLAQQT